MRRVIGALLVVLPYLVGRRPSSGVGTQHRDSSTRSGQDTVLIEETTTPMGPIHGNAWRRSSAHPASPRRQPSERCPDGGGVGGSPVFLSSQRPRAGVSSELMIPFPDPLPGRGMPRRPPAGGRGAAPGISERIVARERSPNRRHPRLSGRQPALPPWYRSPECRHLALLIPPLPRAGSGPLGPAPPGCASCPHVCIAAGQWPIPGRGRTGGRFPAITSGRAGASRRQIARRWQWAAQVDSRRVLTPIVAGPIPQRMRHRRRSA